MISDLLLLAIGFNILLLVIAYLSGYRTIAIISSIIWAIISLMVYDETESILLLAILFMIAAAQIFLPLRQEAGK